MKSMTGYSSICKQIENYSIEIVIQSVNGKVLEVHTQIPNFYIGLEKPIRNLLKKYFIRGSVKILIRQAFLDFNKTDSIQWDKAKALKWKNLYQTMAHELKIQNDLNVTHLINRPGVLLSNSDVVFSSKLSKRAQLTLLKLIQKAIVLCDRERVREGSSLKKEFLKNFKQLSIYLKHLKLLSDRQKKIAQKKFKQKLQGLSFSLTDKNTIRQEVTNWLSKIDVQEELVRMKEHLAICKSLLSSNQVVGKKINFYLQEMVREINTVGSKSHNAIFTQKIISVKSLIESMREQIQNVE